MAPRARLILRSCSVAGEIAPKAAERLAIEFPILLRKATEDDVLGCLAVREELENGFNTIISRRRTQGGRILYAFNKLAAVEFKLSVTRDIKGGNFDKVPVRYDSDGDVIMKG